MTEPLASIRRIEQLQRDLAEATERQMATSRVLDVIGRTESRLEPVFETVLREAVRLCRADAGLIYVLDDDAYRLAFAIGGSDAYREHVERIPLAWGQGALIGRVGLERRTVQIPDVLADRQYAMHRARELGGFRTIVGVPMLAEGRVLGVITLWREEVAPFDERTLELVNTFAAQGAIAIQNVQLFLHLQHRERQLARSVDELHVLGEISQAVSSTLDLDAVLSTIVTRAAQLSRAEGGSILRYEPATQRFSVRTCFGTSEELVATLQALEIGLDATFVGRAAAAGEVRQAPDLGQEPPDPHINALRQAGWRSLVAVPLMREEEIIGVLIVRRREPGGFPEATVDLLQTLASQSVVAIQNARLFGELEVRTRQLEVAGRHKSEFLASMSHELRTPLNAVIGFSDVLLERLFGELNDRQFDYVSDIRDSGRHLLELINEILDLSKVEAGRMDLDVAALSLPELLEHGLAMVRERATRHNIDLSLVLDPAVGVVWADALKLKQVMINLLTNAVKFTPDGGAVAVGATREGPNVCVTVRDTGIGIAEADQERIFEAFQRGDRAARARADGTGLGLTLSKRFVEMHGGRLWMQSRLGAGSTFVFTLPVRPPDAPGTDTAEPAVRDAAAGGNTILVVEDDPRSAELLAVHLEGAGYRMALARDGAEGLEMARRLRPRAVVLDIVLPRVDGWDLLKRLKGDPGTADCPVVVVSMLDERAKGLALGADQYLVKPVDREQLVEALAHCGASL